MTSESGGSHKIAARRFAARLPFSQLLPEPSIVSATSRAISIGNSGAGVTAALQRAMTPILAYTPALGTGGPFGVRFQGSDNAHARKQHRTAVFGGIDQHLNGKPPFLTIAFQLGKLPDVVCSVPQGLRRRPLRKWDRLIERTIPRHT
jgi:hypothetical protein